MDQNQNQNQHGSMLLKVVSIIMIVGGIAGAVISVLATILASAATTVLNNSEVKLAAAVAGEDTNKINAAMWIGVIFLVVAAVIEIIAGVKGKKNWNNPEAAKSLIIIGGIVAGLSLIGAIISQSFYSLATGLVLPVLYIVGAVQLMKQSKQ